jgi:hypothetical protein
MLMWQTNDRRFHQKLRKFFPLCEVAGLNVKLDLPDVTKVSRKTNDIQRESLVIIK